MSVAQPTSPLPKLERFLSSPRHNPTALRLILAAQLRRLRLAAALSPIAAGDVLRCSESKISRLERGEVQLKERDVADLLRLYGADTQEAEEFLSLVRRSNQSGWWHQFEDVLPKWFDKFIGLQEAASVIRTYEVLLVPGLLQTPEYARAVAAAGSQLAQDRKVVDRRVELRLARQELLDYPDAPTLWVVLEENVLHRQVAERQVMYGQLRHLAEMAQRPNIRVQVIPLAAPECVTSGFPITHLRFDPPELPEIVYLEHIRDALYLDKAEETEQYRSILDGLLNSAECPAASLQRIQDSAKRYH
ncbi:helix-turn-helix domain-containing protein [Streptomyces phaeochromogenes]|uniref:helix-turn-helix domain-containing protein n=1 Tax=Streptomyces phaeochromogenes TaxID=1923 RepID=UPI002E29828E|nr:helix-turn-helix transcriptional regulator [Streptomyces phaeochromogenes]